MLGHDTGYVSMMVLHANFLRDVRVKCVFRCQVLRVQVVDDRLRRDIKETLEVLNRLAERDERLQVLQVADMMADKGLPSLAQAGGVLQMGSAG